MFADCEMLDEESELIDGDFEHFFDVVL